jgi:hypothetical protein
LAAAHGYKADSDYELTPQYGTPQDGTHEVAAHIRSRVIAVTRDGTEVPSTYASWRWRQAWVGF